MLALEGSIYESGRGRVYAESVALTKAASPTAMMVGRIQRRSDRSAAALPLDGMAALRASLICLKPCPRGHWQDET